MRTLRDPIAAERTRRASQPTRAIRWRHIPRETRAGLPRLIQSADGTETRKRNTSTTERHRESGPRSSRK